MSGFLHAVLTFPTAVFTILMVVVVLYWLLVILGALHIDIFHAGEHGGMAEGVAEGTAEGVAEGAAEGAGEGAAEGAGDGVGDGHEVGDGGDGGDGDHHGGGGLSSVLHALGLRSAPLTVVVSLIIFYSWLALIFGAPLAGPLAGLLPLTLFNTLLVVLALIVAIGLASLTSRPLGRIFVIHPAPLRSSLIGRQCTVTTGRVDGSFGQAEFDDGGAGMVLQVRCDRPDQLHRGDRATIVAYDQQREAFLVEPAWSGTEQHQNGRGHAA